MKFRDNAIAPIMAMDFDGCMNEDNCYPEIGKPRKYSIEVVNFLHDIGVKMVMWTSRDMGVDEDGITVHDDLTPMINWLTEHDAHYDAINKSVQFSPFKYESRKVYAHMYVDDRAFGFDGNNEYVMVEVLRQFLINVVGVPTGLAWEIFDVIANYNDYADPAILLQRYKKGCINYVKHWRN